MEPGKSKGRSTDGLAKSPLLGAREMRKPRIKDLKDLEVSSEAIQGSKQWNSCQQEKKP
jgi:hypothetical protein